MDIASADRQEFALWRCNTALNPAPAFRFRGHSHPACMTPAGRHGGKLADRCRTFTVKVAPPAGYGVINSHAATVPSAGANQPELARCCGSLTMVIGPPSIPPGCLLSRHSCVNRQR